MARLRFGNPCPGYGMTVATGVFGAPRTGHTHEGWDWTAPQGVPVRASAQGQVTGAGVGSAAAGLRVELAHGSGWTSFYCHLSKVLVKVGDKVAAGQIVGEVGHTGNAEGDHLHAAWRLWGVAKDPAWVVEGDVGGNVKRLQQRLKVHRQDPGLIDGVWGPKTAAAVAAFQAEEGLDTTGLPDCWTIDKLEGLP